MLKIQRAKNPANHVGMVLDASGSMIGLSSKLIEVADRQVAHLAQKSQEHNQETRISIWVFSGRGTVECVVWDMDVLRLPSIADFYEPGGQTALIDAVVKSIDDLHTVSQIYGNHSFLLYVFTDGQENASFIRDPQFLSNKIKGLPDNWTAAAFVPNVNGVVEAKHFGFPAGNIQMWDATSEQGLEEAARVMTSSLDSYMIGRSSGMKSTKTLFDMSAAAVNKQTIQAAGLTPLDPSEYILVPVIFKNPFQEGDDRIDNFITSLGHQFVAGRGYYQLTLAPVKVQIQKDIAIVEKKSGKVYVGNNARALLGVPDNITVTLRAGQNPDYDIYIQSTSNNRKLLLGQTLLLL
ncbi:MAG TPA: vWA domain-containing protein, partial [Candidatus Paceibacterota bacterium]